MESDSAGRLESVQNPPFARVLEWRVYSETYFPQRIQKVTVIADGMVTGEVPMTASAGEVFTLSATVNGRERVRDILGTPALVDSVSVAQTYKTSAWRFPWRFAGWIAIWVAAYVFVWPVLLDTLIYFFIGLFAVTIVTPLAVARAITDFAWWAGHGFRAVRRARWIIATALWVLALGPLVLLQIIVLPHGR